MSYGTTCDAQAGCKTETDVWVTATKLSLAASNEHPGFFLRCFRTRIGSLELKIGSLESKKIINASLKSEKIGSLQVHTGYLTFSLKKKNWASTSRRKLCRRRNLHSNASIALNWNAFTFTCWTDSKKRFDFSSFINDSFCSNSFFTENGEVCMKWYSAVYNLMKTNHWEEFTVKMQPEKHNCTFMLLLYLCMWSTGSLQGCVNRNNYR